MFTFDDLIPFRFHVRFRPFLLAEEYSIVDRLGEPSTVMRDHAASKTLAKGLVATPDYSMLGTVCRHSLCCRSGQLCWMGRSLLKGRGGTGPPVLPLDLPLIRNHDTVLALII